MPMYAVLLRSDSGLVGSGAHAFAEPLVPGTRIDFHDETWTIEDVDDRTSPPTVTLSR
jgi:hypothetical protein